MIEVKNVRFTAGSSVDEQSGLLGFLRFRLGRLLIDGVTLRRTMAGELRLTYPTRRDGRGREHPMVLPVDPRTRQEIERAIFAALGIGEEATP